MTDARSNVLLFDALPTRNKLREAVAKIIRAIQHSASETDETTADKIGVSVGTIRNARNAQTDLNAVTIARIGAIYGEHVLDPYTALYGARNVPIEAADDVALHSVTGAVHRLALAKDQASEGGTAITHHELAEMLPELKEAQRLITSLIVRADKLGLAA